MTAVLVEEADPAGRFIAGANLTEAGLSAFWLDIKITEGTNTRDDTTAFVGGAFDGMQAVLGPLHEECYMLWKGMRTGLADGPRVGVGRRRPVGRADFFVPAANPCGGGASVWR